MILIRTLSLLMGFRRPVLVSLDTAPFMGLVSFDVHQSISNILP